ncbi:MAG TPA: hypothetical protein VNX65_04275 [Patescibacteria group bacterium]|jgi:hypothetical protein|nr:hypothetical protein [Patescibacteria group bacterium]
MKTAIDVVLLPSPEMTAKVIEINRELLKTAEHKIVLNPQNCLPHVTLCMGVIDTIDLPKAKEILKAIAQDYAAFELIVEFMRADMIPTGEVVSGLRIKNTEILQKLHTTIMEALWPYLSYEVDKQMLYNPPEIEDVTFTWITGYAKKHDDPSLFSPHMTAGLGQTNMFVGDFPIQFTASTLALGQLGNYCTCRKVLEKWQLSESR